MIDAHLEEILQRYTRWLEAGKIPSAGRILPIAEAVVHKDWILPTHQAEDILRNADLIALASCTCRLYYKRCKHPVETCLLLNRTAQVFLDAGRARPISLEECMAVLQTAQSHGLVHQAAYQPEHDIWAVCSCCSCCCYRLQILKLHAHEDMVAHSDYFAEVDMARCRDCGICVECCVFGAWKTIDGKAVYDAGRCYGCGQCVVQCPESAIWLRPR